MSDIVLMFLYFLYYLLTFATYAMLARALLSFLLPNAEGAMIELLFFITELFVAPVRYFLNRFEMFQNSVLDMSFMAAYLLVLILQTAVSIFL